MPELPSPAPADSSADAMPSDGDSSAFADILRIEAAAPGDDRPFEDRFKDALNDGVPTAEPSADAAAASHAGEPADEGDPFLAELTKAMQASAAAERDRANAEIDRRRLEHLTSIEARRKTTADEMTALADQDLRAIDDWAEGERRRIDRERETRAAAVRDDLRASLAEHGSRIDREVDAVEAAITAHRANVDAFFTELDAETEPVAIALQARRRPTFPNLTDLPIGGEPAVAGTEAAAPDSVVPDSAAASGEPVAAPAAPAEPESGIAVMATQSAPASGAWHPWANITLAADNNASDAAMPAAASASATPAEAAAQTSDGPERL